jgi:three-Cys-motif partner protein
LFSGVAPGEGLEVSAGTGRQRVSDFDWLVGQLKKVLAWGDQAAAESPSVYHEYGIHTALKLAALNHALDVFTPIARGQADQGRRYSRSVYLDLFSGCGVTKTAKGDWLAGSPVIASHAKANFDEMILVEKGQERLAALRSRVDDIPTAMGADPTYIQGDCNAAKGRVLGLLKPDDLIFVCVDPEGMELHWETIRDIVAACPASDLFVNLTSGADRVLAATAQGGPGGATLRNFTGKDPAQVLSEAGEGGAVLDVYEKGMETELGKSLGAAPEVRSLEGNPRYRLLIRTRKTPHGSPYWRGYQALASRLAGVTAADAVRAIEIAKGRQERL